MTNNKLTIGIKGGQPYIVHNDDNVEVVVLDYDIEGIEESNLDEDYLGNKCIIDILQ